MKYKKGPTILTYVEHLVGNKILISFRVDICVYLSITSRKNLVLGHACIVICVFLVGYWNILLRVLWLLLLMEVQRLRLTHNT